LPALLLVLALIMTGCQTAQVRQSPPTAPDLAGKTGLDRAAALTRRVIELYGQARFSEALAPAGEAVDLTEAALGPDHPDLASLLSNRAELFRALNQYQKAEPDSKRALAIMEKAYGPASGNLVPYLNNLAVLYANTGAHERAETLYRRALAISEKTLGADHPDLANCLSNLAVLNGKTGDLEAARSNYEKALEILARAKGAGSPETAHCAFNLGLLYFDLGEYEQAEALCREALTAQEKALGPDHPDVAASLGGLARLNQALGNYDQAEKMFKRALAIMEKHGENGAMRTAEALNNLAGLYADLGRFDRAEPLYQKSASIMERARGAGSPETAAVLNSLGLLFYEKGDYDKAKVDCGRALSMREKALGPVHPDVANSLNSLAAIAWAGGRDRDSETLLRRALAIRKKALGPTHPDVATTISNLAVLKASMGEPENAHSLFKQALDIDSGMLELVMGFTSEENKIRFLAGKRTHLYCFLSLVLQNLKESRSARLEACDAWLRRKGAVLEAHRRFQDALAYSDSPEVTETFHELALARSRLSRLVFTGPEGRDLDAFDREIKALEAEIDGLENRLSLISRQFMRQKKMARAAAGRVASALPPDSVLVDFALIRPYDFKARGSASKWGPARYLAFILHAGKGERIGLVDLGGADRIDGAVSGFKKAMGNLDEALASNDKFKLMQVREKMAQASAGLHELVFAPLKQELGSAKEIFISPDGDLNLIPFEVLRDNSGRFLIEDHAFYYISTGRDVLGFGLLKGQGLKTILLGAPDFNLDSEKKDRALTRLGLAREKTFRSSSRAMDMRKLAFSPLAGTREEVEAIGQILGPGKSLLYFGPTALEEVLKGLDRPPKMLHLATHGFFLKDMEFAVPCDQFGRGGSGHKVRIYNPLLRSGLALAGANRRVNTEDDQIGSDGILTAEEVLGLRLTGTETVVLSACETGLGEVKNGEGVFGLRRAFTQAGARSLVMSMWSVPDLETKELMVNFYRNLAQGGMNRGQALRRAELEEMEIVKRRYGCNDFFFWGAFIFLGEP